MDDLIDMPHDKYIPAGSSAFQKVLLDISEADRENVVQNSKSDAKIDKTSSNGKNHHHRHDDDLHVLHGKEHCYVMHRGSIVPTYTHHHNNVSPGKGSPTRSPRTPKKHSYVNANHLAVHLQALAVQDEEEGFRRRSMSDCSRRSSRVTKTKAPDSKEDIPKEQDNHNLHVHWPEHLSNPRTRSYSHGSADMPKKPILKQGRNSPDV